ncbi:hypothetical protein ACMYR3_11150 [Ampullimonas aquatilis]|uniref:hypothetical protein n=1 Tax=Ampullimonas aquatilis TaxID=1341549 RepID=UPI003C73CB50
MRLKEIERKPSFYNWAFLFLVRLFFFDTGCVKASQWCQTKQRQGNTMSTCLERCDTSQLFAQSIGGLLVIILLLATGTLVMVY